MSRSCGKRLAVALALAMASCTPLLGLDSIAVDFDRDGIADDRDVCPQDYDPAQSDRDGDGVGEACGPCLSATQDLDADGRDDACDACIGAGATGVDTDDDGIDDGCDACVAGMGTTGSDIDVDGLDDGCDTCIATGADRDNDGIDDACDACLFGGSHDEDGDSVADACDVCPADPDPGQERAEDDMGVACDPDAERDDVRQLFDGFEVLRRGVWLDNSAWMTAAGGVHVGGITDRRESFFEVREQFVVRTFVRFAPSSPKSGQLGVHAWSQRGIVAVTFVCTVDASGFVFANGVSSKSQIDVSQGVELVASRGVSADNSIPLIDCRATDGAGTTIIVPASGSLSVLNLSLQASGAIGSFEWIEAIDHSVVVP